MKQCLVHIVILDYSNARRIKNHEQQWSAGPCTSSTVF